MDAVKLCACGKGRLYRDCCAPYIERISTPLRAESLMRSRYTAFVLRDAAYLLFSWHPDFRPPELDLTKENTEWQRLEVVDCVRGATFDTEGYVEFNAYYLLSGEEKCLHERSFFRRYRGRWVYVSGDVEP